MKIFIGAVIFILLVLIYFSSRRGGSDNDKGLGSELEELEENHVYFQEEITTPLLYAFPDNQMPEPNATGYYLPDEGVILINLYTYGGYGTSDCETDSWQVSSEEEAELVWDTFIEKQEDLLRENELEIALAHCEDNVLSILKAKGIEIDPDDPEWDWGGSYLERSREDEWIEIQDC